MTGTPPTRAQRIETMCETWTNNAAQAQETKTLRAALASAQNDRGRLERALALKDEAIALLRDSLAESEAENETLRAMVANQPEVA